MSEEPKVTMRLTIHQFGGLKATIECRIMDVDRLDKTGSHAEYRQQLVDVQNEMTRAWAEFQANAGHQFSPSTSHR